MPDFDIYTWFGLMVPAKTPDDIVKQLSDAIVPALSDPEMAKRFAAFGAEAAPTSPEDFGKLIAEEKAKYKTLVALSGARVD